MRKAIVTLAFMAAAAAIGTPASAAVNLVTNGDFEANGGSLAGFNVLPGTDIKAASGAEYQAGAGATGSPTSFANHFASFGAGQQENASVLISAAFETVANTVYRLSFDFAQFGTASTQSLRAVVFGTGIDSDHTVTSPGGTDLDSIFDNKVFFFTSSRTGGSTVQFTLAGSPTDSVNGLLDNVSITAVPEASTWALFLLGFGGIGAMYRRRQTNAAKLRLANAAA